MTSLQRHALLETIRQYVELATGQDLTEEDDYNDFIEAIDSLGL